MLWVWKSSSLMLQYKYLWFSVHIIIRSSKPQLGYINNLYLISFYSFITFASNIQGWEEAVMVTAFKKNRSLFLTYFFRRLEAVSLELIWCYILLRTQTFQFPIPTLLVNSSLHVSSDRKEEESKEKGQNSWTIYIC